MTTKTTKKPNLAKLSNMLGVMNHKTKLEFGKYKRKTLNWVLENDASYILWLHENTKHVFDKKLITEATNKLLERELAKQQELEVHGNFEDAVENFPELEDTF